MEKAPPRRSVRGSYWPISACCEGQKTTHSCRWRLAEIGQKRTCASAGIANPLQIRSDSVRIPRFLYGMRLDVRSRDHWSSVLNIKVEPPVVWSGCSARLECILALAVIFLRQAARSDATIRARLDGAISYAEKV